jgi:hypothetical protein
MSKLGSWVSFNSFKGGEKSDLPPHLIPDDSLLGAVNVVTDKIGRLSKRGPIQSYLTNTTSAIIRRIGVSKAVIGGLNPSVGYGVSNGSWYTFDLPNPPTTKRAGSLGLPNALTNGAKTIALNQPVWGPSFNSFGLTAFPLNSSGVDPFVFFANARNNTYAGQTTGASVSVAANNEEILMLGGGISLNSNHIGHFVYLNNSTSAPTREYIGIITGIVSSTIATVYPTPSQAFSNPGTATVSFSPFASITGRLEESGGSRIPAASSFGCVHQNRIVAIVDKTATYSGSLFSTPVSTQQNVLSWSAQTASPATSANSGSDGLLGLLVAGWPKSQSLTLDTAKIVALVSIDANNLLVLCSDKVLLIAGTLGTVLPSVPIDEKSFNIRTLSAEIGCIDADSVQRTPLGIMFAGRDGVYVTDGSKFVNTMADKIQQKWNVYLRSSSNPNNHIVGSALIKDTHYVIFSATGPHFVCDLYNNFSWTELTIKPDVNTWLPSVDPNFNIEGTGGNLAPPAGTPSKLGSLFAVTGPADRIVARKDFYNTIVGSYQQIIVYRNDGTEAVPNYVVETSLGGMGGLTNVQDIAINYTGTKMAIQTSTSSLNTYTRSGTTWTPESTIGVFGRSVAIVTGLGDRIVVGDRTFASNQGRIVIYSSFGGVWSVEATILGPAGTTQFGSAVDIDANGDRIIVGAPAASSSTGAAYVYVRSGTTWTLQATLTPASFLVGGRYGASVAFSPLSDIAVVGAPSTGLGRAYLWTRNVSTWTQGSVFTSNSNGSLFGTSVSCNDTHIAVGAPAINSVFMYVYSDKVWQYSGLVNSNGVAGSNLGSVVKIAPGKNILVTGAPDF